MRLIPVMDIKNGFVVRGVGGRRDDYRPIVSCLTDEVKPLAIARALFENFRPAEIYVADLDAIGESPIDEQLYSSLCDLPVAIWVDAGIRDIRDVVALTGTRVAGIILGLESLSGPEVVEEALRIVDPQRIIFSLDLKAGELLGNRDAWRARDAEDVSGVIEQVIDMGVSKLIVLDLARVGEGGGTGTEDLCRNVAAAHPDLELIAGGGIQGIEDVQRLTALGVDGVLVASALHDGRIGRIFDKREQLKPPGRLKNKIALG